MNEKNREALVILQEECAEVVQEVSKCFRFGMDSVHYKTGLSHKSMLEMEVGDMLALVDILVEQGILSKSGLELAASNKKFKLKEWSSLYKDE